MLVGKNIKSYKLYSIGIIFLFIIFLSLITYTTFTRAKYFNTALVKHQLTHIVLNTVSDENFLIIDKFNLRDEKCHYQIKFTAINQKQENVSAQYCAGVLFFNPNEIQILKINS
mgnify:CR=1 FL=1